MDVTLSVTRNTKVSHLCREKGGREGSDLMSNTKVSHLGKEGGRRREMWSMRT